MGGRDTLSTAIDELQGRIPWNRWLVERLWGCPFKKLSTLSGKLLLQGGSLKWEPAERALAFTAGNTCREGSSPGAACQHGSGVCGQQHPAREGRGVHQAHLPLLQTDPRAPQPVLQTRGFEICWYHSHRLHREDSRLFAAAHRSQNCISSLYW